MHNAMPQLQPLADDSMSCQMPAEPPFRRSTSMTFPLPSQLSDSSMTCQTPVQQQRPLETSMSGLGHSCQHNLDTVCAVCIHPCLTCILPAASVCLRTLAEKSVVIGSQGYLLCASPKQCRYVLRQCRSRAVCGEQREPANSKFWLSSQTSLRPKRSALPTQ